MNITQLGPYSIGKQLGRGGMGTVFEGVNEETGERVAVKVLSQSLAADEGFRDRFEQEIETLRKLRHDNIVRLFGFGEQDGTLFYTMELVEGTSLEQELRLGRRFEWNEAIQIGVQMCRGLKHAHDRGVIHRDIKPANLMITEDGRIKISDFGIAKLFGASGMTMAGGVIGTAEFMAPEQADGRPVSHRSDLYSLGGVLYALIAGRPPFVSKSIVDVLQMQRFSEPEPLRRHSADVPREFDDIVMQLLAKDPQERPSNAAVLMRRLESTARGLTKRLTGKGEDHDFELTPNASSPQGDPGATSQIDVTRVATGEHSKQDSVDLLGPTRQTGGNDMAATQASVVAGDGAPGSVVPSTHYTTVDEDDLGNDLLSSDEPIRNWPQIIFFSAALLAIIGLVWWFMQPPSAEDLWATITADSRDDYVNVSDEIDLFLEHYPNNNNAGAVRDFQASLNQSAETRGYRNKLRQRGTETLESYERIFLRATDSRLTPTQSREQLQALLVLLTGASGDAEQRAACLTATENELDLLEKQAAAYQDDEEEFLQQNLARARTLAKGTGEDREQARAILQSILTLYGNESWAAAQINTAESQLAELTANATSADN